jgi:hypothetical protein
MPSTMRPLGHEPVEVLVKRYLEVSRFVCNALENVVALHDIIARPSVMEGTWLLPSYALQDVYAGRHLGGSLRSLFIYEPELGASRHATAPDRSFLAKPMDVREAQIAMHHAYGLEIKRQADALGLPVLKSRPLETLESRALAALGLVEA